MYATRKYGPSVKLVKAVDNWGEDIEVIFLLTSSAFNSSASTQLLSAAALKIIAFLCQLTQSENSERDTLRTFQE